MLSQLGRPPIVGDEIVVGETVVRVEVIADRGVSEVSVQTAPADVGGQVGEWEVGNHE